MSALPKRKYTKRNFDHEAEMQIQILEQKAREDFLTTFSQCEDSSTKIIETRKIESPGYIESKVYIPAKAKSILEKWMYEHRLYCYPTKTEKQALALETGLSVQKISNWFINSRRRMLPKMLETEGKDPVNFTISRKKKKTAMVASTASNNGQMRMYATNSLTGYAVHEESKIIDQGSIFFGSDFEVDDQQQQSNSGFETGAQEVVVPYVEGEDEESKSSYQTTSDQRQETEAQLGCVARGILYDQETQSKCFFVVINSSNWNVFFLT